MEREVNKDCCFKHECDRQCTYQYGDTYKQCDYYFGNYIPEHTNIDLEDLDFEELKKGELVYIPIEKLYPHPDNPRKELGDLTELADSIKSKGIMQNLTVVPRDNDTYTVVIGHRRLGASKLAGLKELPCVIAEMSPKEQIAVMVMENMQRSDLTIYEEACGMQMMLDLGDTLENVSQQTGLSKTTVRRRVKLLELDKDRLKESFKRNVSIMEYEKLDKIKDMDLKNRVLESIGTSNFDWELKKAIRSEKDAEERDALLKKLNSFATPVENVTHLKYVGYMTSGSDIPDDAGTVKYYYKNTWGNNFCLYREKTSEDLQEENKENEERVEDNRLRKIAEELEERAFECRSEFIKSANIGKEDMVDLLQFAFRSIVQNQGGYRYVTNNKFAEVAGLENSEDIMNKIISEEIAISPRKALMLMAYCNYHDKENESYIAYDFTYRENEELDSIYKFLEAVGYECSDEEQAWRNGTHEIYKRSTDNE